MGQEMLVRESSDFWSTAAADKVIELLGGRIASARPVLSGYSAAGRWLVETASGRKAFAKVGLTEQTSKWLRDEIAVYRKLGSPLMPRLLAASEDRDQPILLLEDLSDHHWPPPWREGQFNLFIRELSGLHSTTAALNSFATVFPKGLPGWKTVAADPLPFLSLGLVSEAWLRLSLDRLLEQSERVQLHGEHVCHFDLRSDNICFAGDTVKVVDWNLACLGNPQLDLGFMLPSLSIEGGPAPDDVLPRAAPIAAVVSGFFAALAGLPADDNAKQRVRNVQKAQLEEALPWAIQTLKLPPLPRLTN